MNPMLPGKANDQVIQSSALRRQERNTWWMRQHPSKIQRHLKVLMTEHFQVNGNAHGWIFLM